MEIHGRPFWYRRFDSFSDDIDINDVRNRYLLTKGSTQTQVCIAVSYVMLKPECILTPFCVDS